MKVLALTGGIASGKSTVARMFAKLGAKIVSADLLAHRVYRKGSLIHRAVVNRYGKSILTRQGSIDRKKLGHILFASKREKAWLEKQIHPAVRDLILKNIQKLMRAKPKLILVEAALHIETGYYRHFEGLIVVHATRAQQLERLVKRDGLSPQEARLRLANQISERERLKHANWVVDNSGSLKQTEKSVRTVWNVIASPSGRSNPRFRLA